MKLIDMHCDSMGEVFLHPEQNILNKGGHLDLSMIKDVGGTVQFFALFMYRKCIEEYGAYDLFHKMYDTYCKQMELNKDYVLPTSKRMPKRERFPLFLPLRTAFSSTVT